MGEVAAAGRQIVGTGVECRCGALEPARRGATPRINGPDRVLAELGRLLSKCRRVVLQA